MSQSTPKQRFQEAATLFRNKDFDAALAILDDLIVIQPKSAPLHFHRGRCLIALDREEEAISALDTALELAPEHVPLLLERAQLGGDENFDPLPLLRSAHQLEPDNAQVLFQLANGELMAAEDDAARKAEALAHLNRSLELDPTREVAFLLRAIWHQGRAIHSEKATRKVRDIYGMEYDRDALEAALQDYTRACELNSSNRNHRSCAKIAEQLGQYELATEHFDQILAQLPADSRTRIHVQEERDRCAKGEAGAREAVANLFSDLSASDSPERSLSDDMSYAITQGVAAMVRQGSDVNSALEALIGDESPDGMVATNIAFQLYNHGNEPAPDLVEVAAKDFPSYQRSHADACEKALTTLGYQVLGDVEATGLMANLGMRALVRVFVHPEYGSAAAFALKPKWPGLLGFIIAFVTGKWKIARMLECMTRFEDGLFMGSRASGPDPFDYNAEPRIEFEKLPSKTSPKQVAERHIERVKARLAEGHAITASDSIETVDAHWAEITEIKNAYRESIGYVTEAELRTLLGSNYERLADKIQNRLMALSGA